MRIFIFLLFFLSTSSYAQKDSISSFLKLYRKTQDTLYINKAFSIANQLKNDSIKREINRVYGIEGYKKNDLHILKKSYTNYKSYFEKNNDSLSLAKYYHYKALYYRKSFVIDSTFYYYIASKNISALLKDSLQVAQRLRSISFLQLRQNDFLGSEISNIKALRYFEKTKNLKKTAFTYNTLGLVATEKQNHKEARQYYKKFFDLIYSNNPNKQLKDFILYHINVGLDYQREGNYKESNSSFNKIITDSIKRKIPKNYYKTVSARGYNYFKMGKIDQALNALFKVLNYREKTKDTINLCSSYTMIGEVYLSQKNYLLAKKYALKGLSLARKIGNSDKELYNLLYLSQAENGKKSKEYFKKYVALEERIIKEERLIKDQFAKIVYETEKKEKENKALKTENERKQLELESEEQQKLIGWLLASLSFLFICVGVFFVKNRRKKLEFQARLKQIEAREKERQQIAKSLHDEVAGDIRILHKKLIQNSLVEESVALDKVKENVRSLSHQLSSTSFEEVSFKNQIINLVSDYFDADFSIKIKGIDNVRWKEIDNSIKRVLFLAIRESILNIDKYAKAQKVNLTFSSIKKTIELSILDDGVGFNTTKKKNGIGLKNMKERIEEIGGSILLRSEENKGTEIKISLPIHVK